MDRLQDRLSQVPLFRKEFDKELREILKGHLDDIKKKVIYFQQIFSQDFMIVKTNLMSAWFNLNLCYGKLSLVQNFPIWFFRKSFLIFFFLICIYRLIRWEMSWLSMLEEILSLFRCWLEPMTWDIKQRYELWFLKFFYTRYDTVKCIGETGWFLCCYMFKFMVKSLKKININHYFVSSFQSLGDRELWISEWQRTCLIYNPLRLSWISYS